MVSVHAANPLNGAWREVRADDTPQAVLADLHAGKLNSFDPSRLYWFPRSPLGNWVVISPEQATDQGDRVLQIYPPILTAASLYGSGGIETVALDDFSQGLHGHGRLAWRIAPTQLAAGPILLKLEPSTALAAPTRFELSGLTGYLEQDARWIAFATACFATMLTMVLMALCFALMLRDITFAWYSGYIVCYALIQGIQTGYVFHPLEWQWLTGMAPLVALASVALSVGFAALFMMRFCELARHAPLLRVAIIALSTGMSLLVLMRCSGVHFLVEAAQLLLNPLLIIGALLLLVAGVLAAARGSRQAWFFLAGWTPLLMLTAMTSAQASGALEDLHWLNDASLAAGAFEAIVLSLGLADRSLMLRHDRDSVRVLADHDALTNVLNRRAWNERAAKALASGPPRSMAMLFMDLDHFKLLNDVHGHQAGDRALLAVAKALTHELRPGDLLGRYGGEEFVALLDNTVVEQAMQVATRLCRRVNRLEIPLSKDRLLLLGISIGIAMRRDGDDVTSLTDRADQAMYIAKQEGRNRMSLYNDGAPASKPGKKGLHMVQERSGDMDLERR